MVKGFFAIALLIIFVILAGIGLNYLDPAAKYGDVFMTIMALLGVLYVFSQRGE